METPCYSLALLGSLLCLTAPGVAKAGSILPSESTTDNLALVYQLREGTRIGLHYSFPAERQSAAGFGIDSPQPARADLLDTGSLRGAPLPIDLSLPQTATLSLYRDLGPQWALLFSAGWQDWSELGRSGAKRDAESPASTVVGRSYRDSWHLAIGTQYRASPKLLWQAGVGYDSSALNERKRTFNTSLAETWRLASGISYAYDRDTELNLNYAFTWMGDMPGTQSGAGKDRFGASDAFANAYFHTLTWSVTWRY